MVARPHDGPLIPARKVGFAAWKPRGGGQGGPEGGKPEWQTFSRRPLVSGSTTSLFLSGLAAAGLPRLSAASPCAPRRRPGLRQGAQAEARRAPQEPRFARRGREARGLFPSRFPLVPGAGASGGVSREVSSAREKPETWGSAAVTGFCGLKIPLIYDELVMSSEFFFFPIFIYLFFQSSEGKCEMFWKGNPAVELVGDSLRL